MSLNVDNCPRCGAIYLKNYKNMCNNCVKEIDRELETCTKYLREHRKITLQELSEATDVSEKQIAIFIREGRISIVDAPNLTYPCEICGEPIRKHTMCQSCRQRLNREMNTAKIELLESEKGRGGAFKIEDRLNKRES